MGMRDPKRKETLTPEADPDAGWFAKVPAYRLATFRVVIAVLSMVAYSGHIEEMIRGPLAYSFHDPVVPWLPPLSLGGARLLRVLWPLGCWGLLLGIFPRVSAAILSGAGWYLFLLDSRHYGFNLQFHLCLLTLLTLSPDRLPLWRLVRQEDGRARCEAWVERLIRSQVAIVFFYAALDKIFSPFWGLTGRILRELPLVPHGNLFAWMELLCRSLLQTFPGVISVGVIGLEFFLAFGMLFRPFWGVTIAVGFGFAVALEFLVRPDLFAWDLLAVLILSVPSGDRSSKFYLPGLWLTLFMVVRFWNS